MNMKPHHHSDSRQTPRCSVTSRGLEPLQVHLRLHVEEVAHGHVGVALAVAVSLSEELVFGPGHVHALGPRLGLVVHRGVGRRVPVVDELSLKGGRQTMKRFTCEW